MKRSRTDPRNLLKKKFNEQEGLPKIIMKLGGEPPSFSTGFEAIKTKGSNVKECRQGKKEKNNKFWL